MYGIEYPTIEKYIEAKIKMLREEFKIRLTKKEIEHMRSLTTEISVDAYCRDIFAKKL